MIYIKSEKFTNTKHLTMAMQFWILLGKSWELCEDIVKVVHTLDHQQDWRYCDFSLSRYTFLTGNRAGGKKKKIYICIYIYEAKINKYVMLHSGRKFRFPSSHVVVFVQVHSLFLTNTRTLLTVDCKYFPIHKKFMLLFQRTTPEPTVNKN